MKLAIEPFLLDNTLMNYCVFALTGAWLGIRLRVLPAFAVSVLGAIYALLSLFFVPALREWYCKVPCFLVMSLPLYREAGSILRSLPFLLLSAATVGGSALMLTLLFGGSISADGSLMGTVPVRAALLSAALASLLPRMMRALLHKRNKQGLYTTMLVRLRTHTYRMRALIDSGNLLREPLSGLPVLLIDCDVDEPSRPIPYGSAANSGVLLGERARSIILPDYGGVSVDCVCARSPQPIKGAQAILPESVLPQDWRNTNDRMAAAHLVAPVAAAAHWQTRYLLVHSHKRRTSRSARSGGGGAMHRACTDRPRSEG